MQFYKLDEVPISRDDTVFRQSPVASAIGAIVFPAMAVALIICAIEKWPHGAPVIFFYFFGVFAGLFGLMSAFNFRATLKPSNWLLRCQLSGLFIKYRAYENWKLPADTLQAAGFDYGEIAWAKLIKERRTEPSADASRGSIQVTWLTYLALGMAKPDTTELEANLQAERNLRPDGRMVILDYPVQVQTGSVVEIRWNAGIRPSAKKALAVVGQRVKILETEHRKTDLTHNYGAKADDEKAKILALAKSGDEMAAVKLARQVYGYDLTQATHFVKGLTGQADD